MQVPAFVLKIKKISIASTCDIFKPCSQKHLIYCDVLHLTSGKVKIPTVLRFPGGIFGTFILLLYIFLQKKRCSLTTLEPPPLLTHNRYNSSHTCNVCVTFFCTNRTMGLFSKQILYVLKFHSLKNFTFFFSTKVSQLLKLWYLK